MTARKFEIILYPNKETAVEATKTSGGEEQSILKSLGGFKYF